MKTYRDIYLTGHKHCSCCKRWRMLIDFGVKRWADEPHCTMARILHSVCLFCAAAKRRTRTGAKPKVWYPHGAPGSARALEHRRTRNRETARARLKDPQYKAMHHEYRRIWYRGRRLEAGHAVKLTEPAGGQVQLDRKPFMEWWNQLADKPQLTMTEQATMRAKRGRMTLEVIDRIMTRAGAADQLVVYYPLEEELSDAA